MKRFLVIVSLTFTMGIHLNAQVIEQQKSDSGSKKVVSVPDQWALYKAENEGKPMLIRKNLGYEKFTDQKQYSIRCGIAFKLLHPAKNGLPQLDKETALNKIEDEIFTSFQSEENSLVTLVITTSGFREYVLYTKNINSFEQSLEKLKAAFPRYTWSTYQEKDETWSTYHSYVN